MYCGARGAALALVALVFVVQLTAQPPTADEAIAKDRAARQIAVKTGKVVATAPKWGFFGTIFHLILEQVNDTKSAYNQISDLVNNQFTDDDQPTTAVPAENADNATTTPSSKISRAEFLRILDRNLKGLRRLRELEWREATKASKANLRAYQDEAFGRKPNQAG